MEKHNPTRKYWMQQSPDVDGMMLNTSAREFEAIERDEILGYLPNVRQQRIAELAAGIGRFTGHLAQEADHITAVDFVGKFIEENQRRHENHNNITYIHGNVMQLELEANSLDFVFINWLMMYLQNEEVRALLQRIHGWLRPQGKFFFRESCVSPSNPNSRHPHSHYRDPQRYEKKLEAHFRILQHGNVKIYERKYNNPNQLWWLCERR